METSARSDAKRPTTPLAGPYGHPIHPILVTVPIGVWIASLIFDLVSHGADDGRPYTDGAELLIGIGVIGAILSAVFGLLDYRGIPKRTPAFATATTHLLLNDVVIVLFAVSWFVRRASDEESTPVWLIVLSIIALLLLSVSGYLGGKLAYRYGVRVADEATQQREGFRS